MMSPVELASSSGEPPHVGQHIPIMAEVSINADGSAEREDEVPVSLLQTALQHPRREVAELDIVDDILQRRRSLDAKTRESEGELDDVALLQTEVSSGQAAPRGPVVRPAGWDASAHAGALPKALQAVHNALSMSPSTVLAVSKAKISTADGQATNMHKASAQDGSPVVDWLTVRPWSSATVAQMTIGVLALLVVVAQSFSAGDLFDAPLKLKKKRLEDQASAPVEEDKWLSPWLSEEPASLFVAHAGRLLGIAGQGGLAEIRGPLDCPVLHAAVAIEDDGNTLRIGSTSTGAEPLMIVGPVLAVGVPAAVAVHRTSTGAAGSLEPLGSGRWALRRDGQVALSIKCDVEAHVLEVCLPASTNLVPKVARETAHPLFLTPDDQEPEAEADPSGDRMVARAALRRCERGSMVRDFDVLEIAVAVGEEVVMPLTCILAVLLMTPDFVGHGMLESDLSPCEDSSAM